MSYQKPMALKAEVIDSRKLVFREEFNGSALRDGHTQNNKQGVGTVTVSNSNLVLTNGLANGDYNEVIINKPFQLPSKVSFSATVSAVPVANAQVYFELVSVDPDTGIPDGKSRYSIQYISSNTNTNANILWQADGDTLQTSANFAHNNSWSGKLGWEIELESEAVTFWPMSGTTPQRNQGNLVIGDRLADPSTWWVFRVRLVNTAAVASFPTVTMGYVLIQDSEEAVVEVSGGRGWKSSMEWGTVPVAVANTPAVTGAVNLSADTTARDGTHHRLVSAASTNATSVKTSAGNISALYLTNNSAAPKWFKLFNKASAPTVGTDVPILSICIPASSTKDIPFTRQFNCSTGIAYAITGAAADADTTAVAANDVQVVMRYS